MTVIHQQLTLEETTPGMVLSDDLLDSQGHILLPKGATLTEHTIQALARHEVQTLRIEMGHMSAEEEAALRARYEDRIEHVFRRKEESTASQTLYQYVRKFRLGEAA